MKKHVKKSLSLFLAILMLATLLPATAMADVFSKDFAISVNPYGGEQESGSTSIIL